MSKTTTLTDEQIRNITIYLDKHNGGVFNQDVMDCIGYSDIEFDKYVKATYNIPDFMPLGSYCISSAVLFTYIEELGIKAVDDGKLTYDQLLGKDPIDI